MNVNDKTLDFFNELDRDIAITLHYDHLCILDACIDSQTDDEIEDKFFYSTDCPNEVCIIDALLEDIKEDIRNDTR